MSDPLFAPIQLNSVTVPNRMYMPAMHLNMAENFQVTDQLAAFYAERARGGVGMICVGFATVDEMSGTSANIGAHDDTFLPGLTRLAEAIREGGARSAVQLNHAGRYNFSFFIGGKQPVAPSAIPSRMTRETPRALEIEEIREIVANFAAAAGRVQKAGFDAVEILAGTGYLISEFLSPLTNQRADEYGGSLENRMRFGVEVVRAVRETVGPKFPIMVRMNGNDFMPGGQGPGEPVAFAQAVTGAGVDALCVNVGWHEARVPQIVSSVPRGVFAYLAREIRDAVGVPVIASHRINDPKTARELIGDGMCDMVAMGRSLIADPFLPQKAAEGREDEIVHCIACAQGCFDRLFQLKSVTCLCNPRAGREGEPAAAAAETPKRVMVVGGGPAGMSAAIAAADRGHDVTLYERDERLGGQLHLAAAPPGREEFAELARDLRRQLGLRGVRTVLGTEVEPALLEAEAPDAVILATGAGPLTPDIPGVEQPHVVQAWDVLSDKALTGKRVAVIGGGAVGVETALFLAEKGTLSGEALKFLLVNRAETPERLYELASRGSREVVLVELLEKIGKDIGKSTRWGMLQDLERIGVRVRTATRALEITPTGVRVDVDGEIGEIPADTVVLAAGSRPYNPLESLLQRKNIPHRVIGDAREIARAMEAVHAGFEAGRDI